MRTYLDCIPCFMQQALRAGRIATSDENKLKQILDRTGDLVKTISIQTTPAETGMMVYRIIREVTGIIDPYKNIKKQHIKETKAIYPELEKIVANSDDRLLTAIKIAIAGNVIDLGVNKEFNIVSDVRTILEQDFAVFDYSAFKKQLKKTESILYIGDNVGESVFDKILIKELKKPVIFAVRSIPIINDVTMEDAIASGLDEVAELIDSGCESPGVILEQSSPEFLDLFNTSGLVISKGQGNFEGLSDCSRQVFFLLKTKCQIISNHLGLQEGSIVLKEHKRLKKTGLIVNPIAGMGGSVGLKGTDYGIYKKAIELGAKPTSPKRIEDTLALLNRKDLYFFVAPGKMGEDYIKTFDFKYEVVSEIGKVTNAADTKRIIHKMIEKNIELLIFVGGDGTARDVYDALGLKIPVVGIPAGVKMFSPAFSLSPNAAAEIINNEYAELIDKEVLDIDEDAFREGKLAAKLYGYLKVPKKLNLLQGKKESSNVDKSETIVKEEIAEYIFENIEKNTLYILGPGTTLATIAYKMGIKKTLLGIDAVYNGQLVGTDLNEEGLLGLIKNHDKIKIVVTPIGGNGFIFGRASKQFTPEVLNLIGMENVIIVASKDKINRLECLRVDTGETETDNKLRGNVKVITGYKTETIIEVK